MTPIDPPAVSVLMPAYNAGRYVARAVESILAQTFADFEFLIVDDGSTDDTRAILDRYAALDPRIRFESRPNTGYLVALNQMLGRARGPLIARMDADDVSRPDRFAKQVAHLADHPDCVLVGSRVTIIDPDGRPLTELGRHLTHEAIDASLMAGGEQTVYHPTVMFRRSAIDRVGAYRPECYLAEDMDLFLRLAEVGRLVNLAEPLLDYREHMAKVGRSRVVQQNLAARRSMVDAHARRGLPSPASLPDPGDRVQGLVETLRTWGWWALGSGHPRTARRYALASMARAPLSPDSWKLLLCSIRGH